MFLERHSENRVLTVNNIDEWGIVFGKLETWLLYQNGINSIDAKSLICWVDPKVQNILFSFTPMTSTFVDLSSNLVLTKVCPFLM